MSMMRARVRGHRWVDHPAAAVMKARVPGQWVDRPAAVVMEAREQGRCWIDHPAVAVMEARVQGRHWVDRPSVGRNKWRWKKAGNPPHNISVAKGPVHIAASRGFVDFVLHSQQARDFLAWTRRTGIPDETFFATVNNMHQFGVPGSYTDSNITKYRIMLNRFKIWDISNRTCSGRFVRHICHFGPREVAVLARSRHLVANKFTYDLHPLAWDCTEQWYFRRVRREEETGRVDVNTEHYRRLVIVQHALRPEHSPWG
ncbi:hypothetical protein ACOMHN_053919 [Nucella lapillus]